MWLEEKQNVSVMNERSHRDPTDLSQSELVKLKRERLQYTVEFSYEHSPFYRELMDENDVEPDDIQTFEHLEQLPIVTGDDIRANQPPKTDAFRFRNPSVTARRPFTTSGSTGSPKTIFHSYDEMEAFFYEPGERGHHHLGLTAGDKVVNYWPFVGLNASCVYGEGFIEKIRAESIPLSNTPYSIEREVDLLHHHNPDVMLVLPSHGAAKGHQFREAGVDPAGFELDVLHLGGEPIGRERRADIAETFNADVFSFYPSTELPGMAYQCRAGEGYHILDDRVHIEIVDSTTGQPLPEGERGTVVITPLLHPGEVSAMPLLRYELGDVASKEHDTQNCSCDINGGDVLFEPTRKEWEFILAGVNLSTTFVENVMFSSELVGKMVREYQLQLEYDSTTGQDVLEILVETGRQNQSAKGLEEEIHGQLLDSHSHLRDTVETVGAGRIDVRMVDKIDLGEGKPTRIVDTR